MGYYDSVKDDVKDDNSSDSEGKGNFDTLKQNASEKREQEEDDTPIEVLDEGLRKKSSRRPREKNSSTSSQESSGSGFPPAQDSNQDPDTDVPGLEQKLDRIIEQNARMIEILESFGS